MVKNNRALRVGFLLLEDMSWAGGVYYVLNIIRSLGLLEVDKVKSVVFMYEDTAMPEIREELLSISNVEIRNIVKPKTMDRLVNRVITLFTGGNRFLNQHFGQGDLDVIYPVTVHNQWFEKCPAKAVYWIPDLQHRKYPQYFSPQELQRRDANMSAIAASPNALIMSSQSALNDLQSNFAVKARPQLLRFRSLVNANDLPSIDTIKDKYGVEKQAYFIVSNQFWPHKNHELVIEAVAMLKGQGIAVEVLMTGRAKSAANNQLMDKLDGLVEKYGLDQQIKFLGFIPRTDQLALLANAKAVIQPSQFEGWSTVVEDVRTVGGSLLLGDIPVNREQMGDQATYFSINEPAELAAALKQQDFARLPSSMNFSSYASSLLSLFEGIVHE